MSVLWIGGQRFAAGFEWEPGLVTGGTARRIARRRKRPLFVDVAGQTGFVDEAEGGAGVVPLAGALAALLRGRADAESWVAFVEEDDESSAGGRLAVIRCYEGLLLPDGEGVFASVEQAFEALGGAGGEDVLVVATGGLAERFRSELGVEVNAVVEASGIVRASEGVEPVAVVPTSSWTRKRIARVAATLLLGSAGLWAWQNQDQVRRWVSGDEPKKERPKVQVVVETDRFLSHCLDELGRRELWLAGFERVAVYCHSSYAPRKELGVPKKLKGRAVLEVRWALREPLPPRVYGRLAEQLLDRWFWAGVNDKGAAVAVSPLPMVLSLAKKGGGRERPPSFRSRVDGMFSLRGFTVEYRWKKAVEVILTTERPLSQTASMIATLGGVEVVSVAFEKGQWRFEGRRPKPRNMFEDRFRKLAKPLAVAGRAGEIAA